MGRHREGGSHGAVDVLDSADKSAHVAAGINRDGSVGDIDGHSAYHNTDGDSQEALITLVDFEDSGGLLITSLEDIKMPSNCAEEL